MVPASRLAPTNGKPKRPEPIEPWYNDQGEACCPAHRKPLRDGDYGPYCSAKAKPGDVQNSKGYCGLKFRD